MINTDYNVEALELLLDKECLIERYYPLIAFKDELIVGSKKLGCKTKNDIMALSDDELIGLGLSDREMIKLLRRFLRIYDPDPKKFKEIGKLDLGEEESLAFKELYNLPGVKHTRALLYFYSGYRSLRDIADADVDDVLEKTALAISLYGLSCTVPFVKEIKTHIAVARAFTQW